MTKEVYFNHYCASCKHYNKNESESPCDECLDIPGREDSHKPEYYEEGGNTNAKQSL